MTSRRIERLACEDEIDREILQVLYEAGSPGLLPKDVAVKLETVQDYSASCTPPAFAHESAFAEED